MSRIRFIIFDRVLLCLRYEDENDTVVVSITLRKWSCLNERRDAFYELLFRRREGRRGITVILHEEDGVLILWILPYTTGLATEVDAFGYYCDRLGTG